MLGRRPDPRDQPLAGARPRALAAAGGRRGRPWEELTSLLVAADVVIVSTGAPTYVITEDLVAQRHEGAAPPLALPHRPGRAPQRRPGLRRPSTTSTPTTSTTSRRSSAQTHAARAGEALRAEAIVEAEVMAFAQERETRAALPVLAELRERAEQIARAEAERTLAPSAGSSTRGGAGAWRPWPRPSSTSSSTARPPASRRPPPRGDSDLPGRRRRAVRRRRRREPHTARRAGMPTPDAAAHPEQHR